MFRFDAARLSALQVALHHINRVCTKITRLGIAPRHTPEYHLCMTESGTLDWLVDFEALAFFTADHAAVENNKLYVNGGFWSALPRDSFPARVVGSLAAVIKVPARAYLENHHITVQLVDQDHDGENLPFRIDGDFRLGASPHLNRGDPSIISLAFPLDGLVLERAGEYAFVLSTDGNELKRYRIHAVQSPSIQLPFEAPGGGDDEDE
jgi:hypothetical protein